MRESTLAILRAAVLLTGLMGLPLSVLAAWSYQETSDPFDERGDQAIAIYAGPHSAGSAFGRIRGAGRLSLVAPLDPEKRVDPKKPILLRVDQHPIQVLRASSSGRLSLESPLEDQRTHYVYHSLLHGVGSEFYWKPDVLVIPVILDIDDRGLTDSAPDYSVSAGARRSFDQSGRGIAPEGLFLRHLIRGTALFLRYTSVDGDEVTQKIPLTGLSGPMEQVLRKSRAERCEDEVTKLVVANGCMDRAIAGAKPQPALPPAAPPSSFSAELEKCSAAARREIAICAR